MSRYEARPAHSTGWLVFDAANPCRGLIAEMVEEAEARIIAWVLNANAEGWTLARWRNVDAETDTYEDYAGPTNGVTP